MFACGGAVDLPELFEDDGLFFGGDAGSLIFDTDTDALVVGTLGVEVDAS